MIPISTATTLGALVQHRELHPDRAVPGLYGGHDPCARSVQRHLQVQQSMYYNAVGTVILCFLLSICSSVWYSCPLTRRRRRSAKRVAGSSCTQTCSAPLKTTPCCSVCWPVLACRYVLYTICCIVYTVYYKLYSL